MVTGSNENSPRVRVAFDLLEQQKDGWPPSNAETLWVKPLSSTTFEIDNIPIYIKGIACGDTIEAHVGFDGRLWFQAVIMHSGHSTYRLFELNESLFADWLQKLVVIGCGFEGNAAKLYAIDVPKACIHEAYALFEEGEALQVWEFEEGFYFRP